MNKRAFSIDALRGYAILTMVLSATIIAGILPGWMFHAQEPPPGLVYDPALSGLTWVDLVFPFFLFAMGAAFPFSIKKRAERGESKARLSLDAVIRGLQLTFFAIFIQHFYPYVLSSPQDIRSWLLAMMCFAILFPMFMRLPERVPGWLRTVIKTGAYAVALTMLLTVKYAGGRTFSPDYSNVIILLLANMAVFASLLYIFTMHNVWARLGVLAIIMGILLGSRIDSSWTKAVADFTPLPWMYRFRYLVYLLIVIPGSVAGEFVAEWMKTEKRDEHSSTNNQKVIAVMLSIVSLALIVSNLYGLYTRKLILNLFVTIGLLLSGLLMVYKNSEGISLLWKKLFLTGAFLLIIGLCFEPFQGGIKKDPPSFSYLFVTSGLAFMGLLFFNILCDYFGCIKGTRFLVLSGQNPMIAYVACDLLIYPLLHITGLYPLLQYFYTIPWLGFLHGILLTSMTVLVTMFFTKLKWFWRT